MNKDLDERILEPLGCEKGLGAVILVISTRGLKTICRIEALIKTDNKKRKKRLINRTIRRKRGLVIKENVKQVKKTSHGLEGEVRVSNRQKKKTTEKGKHGRKMALKSCFGGGVGAGEEQSRNESGGLDAGLSLGEGSR